jgi:hypothetical protein
MAFNIASFKVNGIPYGGARPSLFDVTLTFPAAIGVTPATAEKFTFQCKASDLPESRIGQIDVPYFGRKIRVNGERDYPNWRVSIINDEDFSVRAGLEAWHQAINSIIPNVMDPAVASVFAPGNSYKTVAEIRQYRKTGVGGVLNADSDVIRTYRMDGLFPVDIGSIRVGWDEINKIEEYIVEFAYDWWVPIDGATQRESEEGVSFTS